MFIFDENYERKPSYFAVRDALSTLAIGGTVGGNVKLEEDNESSEPWGHAWMPKQERAKDNEISGDSRPDWEQ